MIKEYVIESDSSDDKNIHMKLNLSQKKKQVLKGYSELIYINNFFEIWKCKLPYEIKLVLINTTNKRQYKIIESVATIPDKNEYTKMVAAFNTALKKDGIDFKMVKDMNNY
jgi:hypothetical protein